MMPRPRGNPPAPAAAGSSLQGMTGRARPPEAAGTLGYRLTMRVLVTGGAGFIGSHYVRTMLTGGYPGFEDAEVTVFDALTYAGNLANLAPVDDSPRYRFVRGDIRSREDLDAALPGHDVVVNFAAESHFDRSISGEAADFVSTNVLGAQQVFDACVRH